MASQSYQLIMRTGPTPGKVFELDKSEIYLGRDVSNDIVVNDSEVSRKHARMIMQAGGYILEDLGSTNGTFVGGQRLMGPHGLRPGEVVMLGENVTLAFEVGYDPDATMVAAPAQMPARPPSQERQAQVPRAQQPAYTGQIPQGPAEPYYEGEVDEKKTNTRTLILAGCGVLFIALCACIAALFFIDQMRMWCEVPFKWFSFLYPLIGGAPCP